MAVVISPETLEAYGDVWDTLTHIKETVETFFSQAEIELPERRYRVAGELGSTSHDCEQMTVHYVQSYTGTPGTPTNAPQSCAIPLSGDFAVEIVRQIPGLKRNSRGKIGIPDPADIEDIARIQAIDSQILLEALKSLSSMQGTVATVSISAPSGEYQAVTALLSTSLSRGF